MFRRKNKIDPEIIRSLKMDLGFDHIKPEVKASFEVWFKNLPNYRPEKKLSDIDETAEQHITPHGNLKNDNGDYPDYSDDTVAKEFLLETLRELEADYLNLEAPIIGMKRNFNMMMRMKLQEIVYLLDEPIEVKMNKGYLDKLANFVTAYTYYMKEI